MEIRNLHTFLQVASLQNFTQAGRILGYSQSNISAQIQQLEREVGAPLFNRIGRHVSLTTYGEELLPYARQIVGTALHMENCLKAPEALGGTIRAGMVESLFELLTEPVITTCHKHCPRVKTEITVDATEALKMQLQQGLLDFACIIGDLLPQDSWRCGYAEKVPIVIIANPENPLSHQKALPLSALQKEEFILMETSAPYSIHFQSLATSKQLKLQSFLKLQSANMALRLVETGNFLSVLPFYTVKNAAARGSVCILEVPEFTQQQYVQIIVHPHKVITPQIEIFFKEIKQTLSDLRQDSY